MNLDFEIWITYGCMLLLIGLAIYISITKNLLRASIAFCIELICVAVILLYLKAEYLAVFIVACAAILPIFLLAISSHMVGNFKGHDKKDTNFLKPKSRVGFIVQGGSIFLGLSLGLGVGYILMQLPWISSQHNGSYLGLSRAVPVNAPVISAQEMGVFLLKNQLVVFEFFSIMILVVIVGALFLIRIPNDSN